MRKINKTFSQSGFTLVELLIVIVIIGILAGVVIGVLNPVQQQARARDGVIRSDLDKMALSTKSLYVSSGRAAATQAPTPAEFAGGISGYTAGTTDCVAAAQNPNPIDATAHSCSFTLNSLTLGTTCGTAYGGSGLVQCEWGYWRNGTGFRLGAKSLATPVGYFVYAFDVSAAGVLTEGFYSCPAAYNVTTTTPAAGSCTLLQ